MELENIGSMITIKGTNNCLGYLMSFSDKGVFDATHGKVDVSKEHADTHNRLLDEAMLEGLDNRCEVGMHGSFYIGKHDGRLAIKTFLGTLVSADVAQSGKTLTFKRNGKAYRGRQRKDDEWLNFKRIS